MTDPNNRAPTLDADFLAQCARAYIVTEPDEERATVVWARNAMEARRIGHGQDDVGAMYDEQSLLVERAAAFDCLGDQSLVARKWELGWWFECVDCGARTAADEGGQLCQDNARCARCARSAEAL